VDVPLVHLRRIGFEKTLCRLRTRLSCSKDVSQELHDDRLRRGNDILGSVCTLAVLRIENKSAYSDSRKAW
jgi:hypothetical protein